MPPSGARRSVHIVHEVADEEDAAAAGLEDVFGRQRVGDFFGIEPFALISTRITSSGIVAGTRLNSTMTRLDDVVLVAVLDRVDRPIHGPPR